MNHFHDISISRWQFLFPKVNLKQTCFALYSSWHEFCFLPAHFLQPHVEISSAHSYVRLVLQTHRKMHRMSKCLPNQAHGQIFPLKVTDCCIPYPISDIYLVCFQWIVGYTYELGKSKKHCWSTRQAKLVKAAVFCFEMGSFLIKLIW